MTARSDPGTAADLGGEDRRDLYAEVRRAVESVPDPELPPVTVGNLGMLHELLLDDAGQVEVELLPTFSGCPAIDVIREDVEEAVARVPGVTDVRIRFRFDPPWTPERIDEEGREALREFGITPPGEVVAPEVLDGLSERLQLPLQPVTRRPCPYCGSEDTISDSDFGPTPCRSVHFCRECMQPFEAFKPL